MDPQNVFLNVPFDIGYEPLLLSLVAGTVCLGLTPRCVVEVPEHGYGRIRRLQDLIGECGTSIHDLSRVSAPPRFNMPFELGLACALQTSENEHHIVVLERKEYRLQKTLSDYNGRDPIIHRGSPQRLIMSIMEVFDTDTPPDPKDVQKVFRLLVEATNAIKRTYHQDMVATAGVFNQVVATAVLLAVEGGLISNN